MKIFFRYLHLKNFLSFDEATVDLSRGGYTLVCGENKNPNDCATSNGSGKSTLFEAILWAITGETIRGCSDVSNIYSDNGCYVELHFDYDNDRYKIIRTKNYKPIGTNLKVYRNDEDKSGKGIKDTSKILQEYLVDLDSPLIGSVILLGQGLPQRFTNNTPSGRKEILEKLSKSDFMINDLKKRIDNRKSFLLSYIRKTEDKILELQTNQKMVIELKKKTEEEIKSLEHEQQQDLSILEKKVCNLESEISLKQQEIQELDKKLSELQNKQECLSNEKTQKCLSVDNSKCDSLMSDIASVRSRLNMLNDQIQQMTSIQDVCPYCGQKLQGVEKPDPTEKIKEKEQVQDTLKKLNDQLCDEKNRITQELNRICSDYDSRKKDLSDSYREFNDKKESIRKEINDKNKDCTNYRILIVQVKNIDEKRKELQNNLISYSEKIKSYESELLYYNNEKEQYLQREQFVSKMFSFATRDFRGYLLTSIIEFINTRSKEYSNAVFENDRIDFILDGNNIRITYDDKDYSNLSGGERQKVDLIVQFSIRDMLCKYLNFSSNILAVDELFDNLDSKGCEKVLDLISQKLFDVESIYIISHHTSIPIPFDNIITAVKGEDGFSHLK